MLLLLFAGRRAASEQAVVYPAPAGRARRRYLVEIDGEDFFVGSLDEAQALLSRAVETAEEVAPIAVKNARRKAERKRAPETTVPVPMLRVGDDADAALRALVERMQADIDAAYERAAQDYELRLLLHARMREQDDEDAILLLA